MSERSSERYPYRWAWKGHESEPIERQECERYREALERIAGPPDRPFLGFHGKLAMKALRREPASVEVIADRARRDYEHYVEGVPLLMPQHGFREADRPRQDADEA